MFRKSNRLILLALLLWWGPASAQGVLPSSSQLLAIDAGFHFHSVEPVNQPYIRGDLPSSGFLSDGIGRQLGMLFAGLKAEKIFFEHRLGLSVGLRYTNLFSSIYRNSIFPNHIYLLHRQEGTTTEYLRLTGLEENLYYVGVPLEVRLYLNPKRRWFLMAGGEWSYRVARDVTVEFKDPDMKIYSADVKSLVQGASEYYGSLYVGTGVRLGKQRPRWSLGLNVPLAITASVSSLNTPRAGGAGLQVQYVLSKSHTWYEGE